MRTPVLRLGKTLLTALSDDLSDDDVVEFQVGITHAINAIDAEALIIDVSALDIIDSFMARVLNDTAAACRLLGSEVVVCGLQPNVVITLKEMGQDFLGVTTALDLEQGLKKLGKLPNNATPSKPGFVKRRC